MPIGQPRTDVHFEVAAKSCVGCPTTCGFRGTAGCAMKRVAVVLSGVIGILAALLLVVLRAGH